MRLRNGWSLHDVAAVEGVRGEAPDVFAGRVYQVGHESKTTADLYGGNSERVLSAAGYEAQQEADRAVA